MAHSREIRPHAHEVKFIVSATTADGIRQWARQHLDRDPHGSGPFGDEYTTASLYFDNPESDVFHRRGSFGRSKYRIRRYGDEGFAFLERKMRQPAVLAKRRTVAPLTSLSRLSTPDQDEAWPGVWFHRRVVARRLAPVCQVRYARMARAILRDGEPVRLTLDADLCAVAVDAAAFTAAEGMPVLPGHNILELKYRGTLPAVFRRLVEEFALTPQIASKFRLGVAAIGRAHPGTTTAGTGAAAGVLHA
jgi:hypothetical protein